MTYFPPPLSICVLDFPGRVGRFIMPINLSPRGEYCCFLACLCLLCPAWARGLRPFALTRVPPLPVVTPRFQSLLALAACAVAPISAQCSQTRFSHSAVPFSPSHIRFLGPTWSPASRMPGLFAFHHAFGFSSGPARKYPPLVDSSPSPEIVSPPFPPPFLSVVMFAQRA